MDKTTLGRRLMATALVAGMLSAAGCSGSEAESPRTVTTPASESATSVVPKTATSGTVTIKGKAVTYRLTQPVVDNREAFARFFAGGSYAGDLGDKVHLEASTPGDHTPISQDDYSHDGKQYLPQVGWVYAQDFMGGGDQASGFDPANFTQWLQAALKRGQYPEVKLFTYRKQVFTRASNWTPKPVSNNSDFVHVSYMMSPALANAEQLHSTIMADYARALKRPGA